VRVTYPQCPQVAPREHHGMRKRPLQFENDSQLVKTGRAGRWNGREFLKDLAAVAAATPCCRTLSNPTAHSGENDRVRHSFEASATSGALDIEGHTQISEFKKLMRPLWKVITKTCGLARARSLLCPAKNEARVLRKSAEASFRRSRPPPILDWI